MFHSAAVPEIAAQEWIEIYNPAVTPVSVAGWKFSKGVDFAMRAGTMIPAGGYLVVAADVAVFNAQHPSFAGQLTGGWIGTLSNGSEHAKLVDALGWSSTRAISRMMASGQRAGAGRFC